MYVTIIILLSLIVIWFLAGYLPGRSISPKNNRWQAWGPGTQIWGYIDGDKPKFLPYPMPPGFHLQYRELKYSQDAEGTNLEKHEDKSKEDKPIVYHKADVINGLTPIRWVTEEVNRLRKEEIHPYLIPIDMPASGFKFYLRLLTTIEVNDPMQTLKLDQFLVMVGSELKDAAGPWGPAQEETWAGAANLNINDPAHQSQIKNLVVTKMLALKIDEHSCITINGIPLMKYMNSRIKKYGIEIIEFSLNVGYDDNVKTILSSRASQQAQDEVTVLEEKRSLTQDVIRTRDQKNGEMLIGLDQKRLTDVQKPAMEAYGEMKAKENGAWKDGVTLFLGNNTGNDQITGLLAGVLKNTKKGGDDANQPAN